MFKLSAAAKKKPRRHNTEVSVRQKIDFVMAMPDVQKLYTGIVCCYNGSDKSFTHLFTGRLG